MVSSKACQSAQTSRLAREHNYAMLAAMTDIQEECLICKALLIICQRAIYIFNINEVTIILVSIIPSLILLLLLLSLLFLLLINNCGLTDY